MAVCGKGETLFSCLKLSFFGVKLVELRSLDSCVRMQRASLLMASEQASYREMLDDGERAGGEG